MKPILTGAGLWLSFLFFLAACEKPKSIGADIIPPGDLLNVQFTDTLSVEIETRLSDSTRTDEQPVNMFGNLIDPDFGRILTSTFTSFRMAGSNLFLGDSLQLDSIVLQLELTGFYGDYKDAQILQVYELEQKPLRENTYYNSDSISVASSNLLYSGGQSIQFGSEETFKQPYRIRLSNTLGQKILNATPEQFQNNETFTEFFKGLYLSTSPVSYVSKEPGAVYYFKPDGSITGLYLYYKGKIGGVFYDTLSYRFQINEDAGRFSRIRRQEIAGSLLDQVKQNPEVQGKQYALLQAGIPVNVFVKIPNLHNLFPVAVNKAELELPVLTEYFGGSEKYQPPSIIQGQESDALGNAGDLFTSAIFDLEKKVYTVALSSYSQRMINSASANYGFYLSSLNQSTNLNRVVLAGMNHPTRKPKLKISYTSVPK